MEHNGQTNLIAASSAAPPAHHVSNYANSEEFEPEYGLRDYLNILLKRKWLFLGIFFSIVLLAGIYTFMKTPVYVGSVVLQIVQDNPEAIMGQRDPMAMLSGEDSMTRFYETQYLLLHSRTMGFKLMRALNLQEHPEYKPDVKDLEKKPLAQIEEDIVDQILLNLTVTPLKKSSLVEIFYRSTDPKLAEEVPNTVSNEYSVFCMETRRQSYSLIRKWLENELQHLSNKVVGSEKNVYAHGQKKDFLSLEGDNNVIVKKYVELNKILTAAESDRAMKEAQYKQIKEKGIDAPAITNNPLIQALRQDLITQEAKVSRNSIIFGKNYPQVQAEKAQLAELRARGNTEVKRTEASIKADYEAALRAEKFLREEVENQKKNVANLQQNLVEHHSLTRELQTNVQLYEALLSRMKEASVASTMVTSNVGVTQSATLPYTPASPKKLLYMVVATLAGMMCGFGAVILAEYFDDSIKTTEEMEKFCRTPSLGVVPLTHVKEGKLRGPEALEMETLRDPQSMFSESIHHVNTSIALSLSGGAPQVMMVTSANPSEGKTTISVNMAFTLALSDHKVAIIDADMRKPMIHKNLKQPLQPGLSNFLSGSATQAEIIHPTDFANLYCIPAGPTPPSPIQLLNSEIFLELLTNLRKEFRYLIIDTPPIIGFADGRSISSKVDGVILVIKHHYTSRYSARLASQLLFQVNAPILGVVCNMTMRQKLGYGGYYNYYKYYTHYYKQYHNKD